MDYQYINNFFNNNLSKLFFLLIANIYFFNSYESLSKFDNLINLIKETLPISMILLISYFADYIRNGFLHLEFYKNLIFYQKIQNYKITTFFKKNYQTIEKYLYLLATTIFLFFSNHFFQLIYFWYVHLMSFTNWLINYMLNQPILPYNIDYIQHDNNNQEISYYNYIIFTFALIYILSLYFTRYLKRNNLEFIGLSYLLIHYLLAPSIFKLILNRKFDLIIFFNFKIIITVFLNQLFNYLISFVYPSWINNNLIPFGGFHLWSIYTFLAYFVLDIYDVKIFFGYCIIFFQYYQNKGNPTKQFKSIPNQLICIVIDCFNSFSNEYKNRENQKKINNQEYVLVKSIEKQKNRKILYYQIDIYDKILINKNNSVPQDCIVIKNLDNNDKLISVNTVKIDGEINDKYKKVVETEIFNDKKNLILKLNKNKIYYIKKGSIVKSNVIVLIINIPNKKNYLSKVNNNKFYYFIKNIEKTFFGYTILLTLLHSILYYLFNKNFSWYSFLQILMSIQMINPMIMNTVLLFVNNFFKKIYISTNSKYKLISLFDNSLPSNNNNKIIHFTDKTGTLTMNKLNFFGLGYYSNNQWNYFSIKEIHKDTKLLHTIIASTLNNKINHNIIPEEKAIFDSLKIKWLSYKNFDKYSIKQVEINNKLYVIQSINIGIDKILRGSYSLIIRKKQQKIVYNIIIQCSNNLFSNLEKTPDIINFEKTSLTKDDLLQLNKYTDIQGAPRFWNLLISNDFTEEQFTSNMDFDTIRNISIDSINNNFFINLEKYHHKLLNFIFTLKFHYLGCLLIKDIYMENAQKIVSFNNSYLNCNTCIITGDNYANASIIAENLNFDENKGKLLYCDIDKINQYILNNNTNWFFNKNIVFYNCNPEDKEFIIKYFKKFNFNIIYSGDGLNDIYAMKESDFVIGFPDSSLIKKNKYQLNPYVEIQSDLNINKLNWEQYINNDFFDNTINLIKINHFTIINILIKQCLLGGLYSGFMFVNQYKNFSDPFNTLYYQIYMFSNIFISFKYIILYNINPNIFEKYNTEIKNIYFFNKILKYYLYGFFIYFIINLLQVDNTISLILCLLIQLYN
jgi:hypothetical protein